jgi:hypothetical protein
MVYEKSMGYFIILGVLCGAIGFFAGYGARGIAAGRERDTLTVDLERHRRELDAVGKQNPTIFTSLVGTFLGLFLIFINIVLPICSATTLAANKLLPVPEKK